MAVVLDRRDCRRWSPRSSCGPTRDACLPSPGRRTSDRPRRVIVHGRRRTAVAWQFRRLASDRHSPRWVVPGGRSPGVTTTVKSVVSPGNADAGVAVPVPVGGMPALFRGSGLPTVKSATLPLVSTEPLPLRSAAVVLLSSRSGTFRSNWPSRSRRSREWRRDGAAAGQRGRAARPARPCRPWRSSRSNRWHPGLAGVSSRLLRPPPARDND